MKKTTKACLIISVILLLSGASLVFYALYSAGFDWNKFTVNVENGSYDYIVVGEVRDIKINTKQADVHVVRSTTKSCTVQAKIASREGCSVETNDGLLTVTCTNDPSLPWYERIWRQDDMVVTVFLPNEAYENLEIRTGSGDVIISNALSFSNVRTKTGSGDQDLNAPVSETLSATTSSGYIAVKRMNCSTISVTSESGEQFLENCRSESISASASSGSVTLAKCNVKNVQTNTASGDIVFSQIEASEHLNVTSSSGDILYIYSSAADMQIIAKSGDVTGNLLEPMLFDVHSDSGDIVLPPSSGTNRCFIRTGSGNVTFTLRESDEE